MDQTVTQSKIPNPDSWRAIMRDWLSAAIGNNTADLLDAKASMQKFGVKIEFHGSRDTLVDHSSHISDLLLTWSWATFRTSSFFGCDPLSCRHAIARASERLADLGIVVRSEVSHD